MNAVGDVIMYESPYTIPLVVAALTLAVSALYIWWRHRVIAAKTLSFIFLSGSGWITMYAVELAETDLHTKIFWSKLQYFFIIAALLGWLVFTLQYTGRTHWITHRTIILFSVIPFTTAILVATNEYHGLIWSSTQLKTMGSFIVMENTHGAWFWVHTAYSYIILMFGSILLIQLLIRSKQLYRWQIGALLLAAFFPLLHSILNILRLYPVPYLSVAMLLFPAGSLVVALSIFRFRPSDIVPVARGAVIEGMSDGIIVLDPANRIMDVNTAGQAMLGQSAAELMGVPIQDVWPYWSDYIGSDEPLQVKEKLKEKEIVITQEGTPLVYDVRISPLTDWQGNCISQIIQLRDITDRKRAQELLQESEEKFRTIFENANDEIIYLDKDGVIIDINKKSEEIFGYKRKEVVGRHFAELDFIPVKDITIMETLFKNILMYGEPADALFDLEMERKGGGTIYAEVSIRLVKKNGEITGLLAILRDITKRKKSEEKIKSSLKEKEVLLREIHHRVKNNLQIVSSLLNLQSSYIKDDKYKEMFRDSQSRIRSMGLIHEKLYQSKDLARIDLEEYIKTLVHDLVRSYGAHAVTIVTEIEDISLDVDTAIPCGLIINELVSNSLKHAFPHGKGKVSVSIHFVNGDVELVVSDDGIGMPDIDFKTTETLGLRLVNILADDQLGGEVALEKNGGTTFYVRFKMN
ncbi:MAG: histidine kinase N-terminal 7TM domain-containing protein [Candidatus Methanofastidiosia archaeon]|jgi:PAS domain S-box-containing protein